jgi:hypothetical protein
MSDDRMIGRLEEQLRDAHAANAELRAAKDAAERREKQANALVNEWKCRLQQLETAYAKQKAAEDNAAAAQRKQAEAEREALKFRGENDELRVRAARLQVESDALNDLNARIEAATHVRDLIELEERS